MYIVLYIQDSLTVMYMYYLYLPIYLLIVSMYHIVNVNSCNLFCYILYVRNNLTFV